MSFTLIPPWYPQALVSVALALSVISIVGQALRPKFRRIHGLMSPVHACAAFLTMAPVQAFLLASWAALLLPFWWLAQAVALLLGDAAPGGLGLELLFAALVGAVYLGWLVLGFMRPANAKFAVKAASDERAPATRKRVAVIGAGMAGLTATKELLEEGHTVVVYEAGHDWGGVWNQAKASGGVAWARTMTSTGALNTVFSDAPRAVWHDENGATPMHYTRAQFFALLQDYEHRYRVWGRERERVRFNTRVVEMKRLAGGRWALSVEREGRIRVEAFDAVTICTGLNEIKHEPDYPGREQFSGDLRHAERYAGPESYVGQRVLVLGTGETAADIVKELVDVGAEHVYVSQRGPTFTLPRNGASVPPDFAETRLAYGGPMFSRYALLVMGVASTNSRLIKPTRVRLPSPRLFWTMLLVGNPLANFPRVLSPLGATKSDNLWFALDTGKASLHKEVARFESFGATMVDGERVEVDSIIMCTGFRRQASFLAGAGADGRAAKLVGPKSLYKLTFDPDLPNVGFIGLARGQVGAITIAAEMQARWWALVVSGKRELPSAAEMRREARWAARRNRFGSQPTRSTMSFINSLARHEVGCEPEMFELFVRERRLWWQLLIGAICAPHYRLHGVHAKPELAREQLGMRGTFSTPDYVDLIDLSMFNLPLSAAVTPLWSFYARLIPCYGLRSALSTYW